MTNPNIVPEAPAAKRAGFELQCGPLLVKYDHWQITLETSDGHVRIPLEADAAINAALALQLFARLLMTDLQGQTGIAR